MTDTAYECYFWDREDQMLDEADQAWYEGDDEVADMWDLALGTDE
jgi:hypothetical protein